MPTPITTDTFSDTAGTNLSVHTPDTGGTWAYPSFESGAAIAITAAGRVRNNLAGQSTAVGSVASTGNAVTVTWDLYAASLSNGFLGVGIGAPSQATYAGYQARYDLNTAAFQIYSFGSGTLLGSTSYTLTAGQTYHCQFTVPDSAVSATKTLYVNGSAILSVTDSAVATNGRVYIDAYNASAPTDTTGLQIDNLSFYNSAFAPITTTTLAPDAVGVALSPGNQYVVAGTSLQWIHTATSARFNFTGTSLGVNLDLSLLTAAGISTALYPYLNWSIDGAGWQRTAVTSVVALASGLASATHTAEVRYEPLDESDTWTPHSAVKVIGWVVDSGSALSAPTGNAAVRSKLAVLMGDSITRGYAAVNSALTSYGPLLGHALNAEIGIIGFSGQGWGKAATNVAPAFTSTFGYFDSAHARTLPTLDYFLIAQGTNDGTTSGLSTLVQSQLATVRSATGARTLIVILLPFNGQQATPITTGINAYIAATSDPRVLIVDTSTRHLGFTANGGPATQYAVDGVHPTSEGHALLAADLVAAIKTFESASPSLYATPGSSRTVGGGVLSGL